MKALSATELRIGNLVYYHIKDKMDEKVEWDEINHIDVDDLRILTDFENNSEYKPIPLTEEWLLKFGANKYESDHKANQYRIENMLFVIRKNTFFDYGTRVKLQFVHQLQNLYFALTGEELILNEKL